jgi:DNA repair protein RadC
MKHLKISVSDTDTRTISKIEKLLEKYGTLQNVFKQALKNLSKIRKTEKYQQIAAFKNFQARVTPETFDAIEQKSIEKNRTIQSILLELIRDLN